MEGQLGYFDIGRRRKKVRTFKKKKQEKVLTKLFLTYLFVLLMSVPVAYALGKVGVSIKIPKKIFTFRAY